MSDEGGGFLYKDANISRPFSSFACSLAMSTGDLSDVFCAFISDPPSTNAWIKVESLQARAETISKIGFDKTVVGSANYVEMVFSNVAGDVGFENICVNLRLFSKSVG